MNLTNMLLALNALLLAAILAVALQINGRPHAPTVGELAQLRAANPAAWSQRLKDRPQIETGLEFPHTVELSNAKPIEVEVTNRTEVAIVESVTLDVQTYVQPLDVRIVTTGYAPADGPLITPKPTTSKQGDYDLIFDASLARAIKEFPWSANAQSAGSKRMAEIDAQLERTKDPLFNNPEKNFLIAQRVAQEFAAKKRKP